MELVSVVIPVYKVEKYLERCVKSVREQTYKELEIILVDDGSPDSCGDMCDTYAREDSRVRVIHKENGGLSDARNAGIREATGTYLLFVDSDDHIHRELVSRSVECAQRHRAEIVVFDFMDVDLATGSQASWSMPVARGISLSPARERKLFLGSPSACNKLFLRCLWTEHEIYFPVGRTYEDLSTIPKLYLHAECVVYLESEPLYYYVHREGSIMHSHDFGKSYANRKAAVEDLAQYFQKMGEEHTHREELEYLAFEHMYFVPSKEIVLADRKSEYLKKFRQYAHNRCPEMLRNPYIKEMLSLKDRIMLALLVRRLYAVMNMLSALRRAKDGRKRGEENA